MKKAMTLAVIGGDMRQASLARLLAADGHTVSVYALERQPFDENITLIHDCKIQFDQMKAILLPLPVGQDNTYLNAPLSNATHHIKTILDAIPSGKLVLGGAASRTIRERAESNQLKFIDYMQREELAVRNAVPIALAIGERVS